jgi:phosphomevalonate kinase
VTIAHAPGKVVLSGAYVVLDGAEAVVAAVDRYAIAYGERPGSIHSPELREAFPGQTPPFVDTSSMWTRDRKIGLGSSSAALVAALGSRASFPDDTSLDAIRTTILAQAYAAHRRAQGGGSGIDVCASTLGGVLICRIAEEGPPSTAPITLPAGLFLAAFRCPESSSTARLLGGVRALRAADRARYDQLSSGALDGANEVAAALRTGDLQGVLRGLRSQVMAMRALGDETLAPILPPYLRSLDDAREDPETVIFQAGAGGGDVALYAGREPPTQRLWREAAALGLAPLTLSYGVAGVSPGLPPAGAILDEG